MKRYDSYKDSGVEWIGVVPSHWNVMKTSLAFHGIGSGTTPSTSKKEFYDENEGYYWLQTGDLNDGIINETSKKVTKFAISQCNLKFYPKDSIVIAMYGATIGKVGILGIKTATNQACCVLPTNKNMNAKFAFYEFLACKPALLVSAIGGGQPNISQDVIRKQKIVIPPLLEQDAIASYLDKKCSEIDKVISAQQKRIALLQELKQSVITHAVTKGLNPNVEMKDSGVEWIGRVPRHWEVYKIKNCCKTEQYSIKTGPFGTQLKGEDLQPQGDVAVYSQQNVINNDFTKVRYFVSNKKAETLKGFYTRPNDVLVTSRGTIGKAAILSSSFPNGILHPCLIALRLNQDICLNDWLVMYINETDCFKTDVYLSSNATTIDVIYTGTLKNIYIPIPPHEEQLEILKSIREKCALIDASLSKAQHQVELLQEYKQSLITEVVTGKRKVS